MDIKGELVSQYGTAFIEALDNNVKREVVFDEVHDLYHAIKENQEYINLLGSPIVENDVKKKLITELLAKNKTDYLKNMFFYMVDKDDLKYLLDILKDIIDKMSKDMGYLIVKITSAYELSKNDIDAIVKKVSTKLKMKKVIPEIFIDPSYIAGISIEYDSNRIDNSIKSKLDEIKRSLLAAN